MHSVLSEADGGDAGAAGVNGRVAEGVVRRVAAMCAGIDFNVPPPVPSREVYRMIREATGIADPFRDIKRRFNDMALALYPRLEALVEAAADPFDAAARVATAGNIIDLGVKRRAHGGGGARLRGERAPCAA